jgi:1-acyl-sn-glycerol-3-phosphate acyltransferase
MASSVVAFAHTLFSRFLLLLIMIVGFIPAVIFLFLVPAKYRYDNKMYNWCEYIFYILVLKATLLKITYKGLENIPHDEPAIIAANHQSSLDIPLIGAMLKRFPHIWLATITLMDSPILRFILPHATVLIDMSSPMKGMRSLIQAIQMIHGKHRHVVLFPEGGRFTDGSVHDFYAGFVILTKKTGRPVVPVRIFGANRAYPPKVFLINNSPITVVVGKPLYMQEDEDEEAFKNRVYQWFLEQKE